MAARADAVIACGKRDQNRAAIQVVLDCLERGLPIHASQDGIRAGKPVGAPYLFCESAGSGGRPKTIRRSHASWIASFEVNRSLLGITRDDRYAVLGNLGHSLSLYATLEALHLGAGLLLLGGDSPRNQSDQLRSGRVTVIYATPTQLRRLLLAAEAATLPDIRHILCGGGRLDDDCRAGIAMLCPNSVLREFYGTSETSFITIADPDTPRGSVGRAYPGVTIKLDEDGRIRVASPYLFNGYDSADTRPADRDGAFIITGDMGVVDGDGYLFLRGRANRRVKVADQNLFLEDVEAVLTAAGAGPCVAVAVPDALRGDTVVAVVEGPRDDALTARLTRACRDALGEHAAPRRYVFVPRLPMLPSDKPDLAALTRLCTSGT